MLSVKHNFLFIHVPKTGGNSVQRLLSSYSEDELVVIDRLDESLPAQDNQDRFGVYNRQYGLSKKHTPLSGYKSVISPDVYDGLYKFSVIRNPWDRAISHYLSPHRNVEWDREAFVTFVKRVMPLQFYICENQALTSSGSAVVDKVSGLSRDLDALLRFEYLAEDFDACCNQLGLPKMTLPQLNRGGRKHYSHYYDEELKDLVYARFIEEITYGGYVFERR